MELFSVADYLKLRKGDSCPDCGVPEIEHEPGCCVWDYLRAMRRRRQPWYTLTPVQAGTNGLNLDLSKPGVGFWAPLNEMGRLCPWPWEPEQLVGVPMGQYHCGYCGGMQVAGVPHLDTAQGRV